MKIGFTVIKSNREEKPQCVLCSTVLASTTIKLSKLKRHLEKQHPKQECRFLQIKAKALIKSRLDDTKMFWKDTMGGLQASYEVSKKYRSPKTPRHWSAVDIALL